MIIRVLLPYRETRTSVHRDERFLYVSGFRLLGFGAVKMSRVTEVGHVQCEIWPSCETFTNSISITKYALEFVSVSSQHCIRSRAVRWLGSCEGTFTPVCVGFGFPSGLLRLIFKWWPPSTHRAIWLWFILILRRVILVPTGLIMSWNCNCGKCRL